MSAKRLVWVIEVLSQGDWRPTSAAFMTRREGRAVAQAMNDEDESESYRVSPYVREQA